jgi:hypothetical protein
VSKMRKNLVSMMLITLLLLPLIPTVQAEGEDDWTLEARAIAAVVNADETVTVSWRNIDTVDASLIEDLQEANYSVYRSDEPVSSSNYLQAQLVENEIQACESNDTWSSCKSKAHSVNWMIPAGENGHYYYGIITTLSNGSISDNLSIGNSTLAEPVLEVGSKITSPYGLQATYDVERATTTLSWVDITVVDPSVSNQYSTSIWSHAEPANYTSWESITKSAVVSGINAGTSSYDLVHSVAVDRDILYSVIHVRSDGTTTDVRFLSGNTLSENISEDNIGSSITGTLQASFNATTQITALNWSGAVIEDENHTLMVWRAPAPITDTSVDGVEEITRLPGNSTHYNHTVESGTKGTFYYLVNAIDEFGNALSDLSSAPAVSVAEQRISTYENIVTDLSVNYSHGITTLTWSDLSNHPEATYHIWRSTTSIIDTTMLANMSELAMVDAGVESFTHNITTGQSEDAWYAITVSASFGTHNLSIHQDEIVPLKNGWMSVISEDLAAPNAPALLNAQYQAENATTRITWNGVDSETGATWYIYQSLYTDATALDDESRWSKVGELSNSGATTSHVIYIAAMQGTNTETSIIYAIGGIDSSGNEITVDERTTSNVVLEDQLGPEIHITLTDSTGSHAGSRWFSGAEVAEITGLAEGAYTITFSADENLSSLSYIIEEDTVVNSVDITGNTGAFVFALTNSSSQVALTFTIADMSGNDIEFSISLCSTCLVKAGVNSANADSDNIEADPTSTDGDKEDKSVSYALAIICVILLVVLLIVAKRNSMGESLPRGMPTKAEDSWVSKYINRK